MGVMRRVAAGVAATLLIVAPMVITGSATDATGPRVAQGNGAHSGPVYRGIHKIRHIVIIMQENRSFDSYFGTYPGADGLPRDAQGQFSVCVPDPKAGHCARPYHDRSDVNGGGPHFSQDTQADVD